MSVKNASILLRRFGAAIPLVTKPRPVNRGPAEPNTAKATLRLYWSHVRRYPKPLAVVSIMLPVAVVLQNGLLPLVYSRVIDQLNRGEVSGGYLHYTILLFVGLHLAVFTLKRLMNAASSRLEFRVIRDLEQRIFNWLLMQENRFHSDNFAGAIVAQAKRFTGAYSSLYTTFYFNVLSLAFRFVTATAFLVFIAPPIAFMMMVWSLLYVLLIAHLTHRKTHMTKAVAAADTAATARLADVIGNATAVRMFGREDDEASNYRQISSDKYGKRRRDWRFSEAIIAVQSLLMITLEASVLYYSGMLVQRGDFTIGQLALVQFFLAPILLSLWDIGRITRQIETGLSDAGEMTTVLARQPAIVDTPSPEPVRINKGDINFDGISFGYNDAAGERPMFRDFSLHIKPGQTVGLAGHSGGGKSTLSKLLLRFMDVDSGRILIDGQDITNLRQQDFRRSIAFVPQEPLLFHRSIMENIRYGQPEATDEQVMTAARQARAHDFIARLPLGYETPVGERGGKLSGGERQRIAIARAILKDAPIIVMDEATSALDSESEKLIQEALWQLLQGKTAIIIAHRLSTIRTVDRIVVLDKGRVVEEGTHRQLLKRKGAYAELWAHQSGGVLED